MERITLTRAATSQALPASLRITIRVKTRPIRVALLAAAIALWICGAVTLALPFFKGGALEPPSRTAFSALEDVSLLAFSGIGVALVGHLAWILFGRETYMISPLALCVRRSIGPFGVRRTYRFADLLDARIIPRRGTAGLPPWKLMCLETERESIVLRHRERYVRLARDLDKAEGAYLLTAIRLWMQDR
jgi:hypothetical protein